MKLRPHQEKAIELLRQSFKAGNSKPMVAAPCSFGKTHLAAYLMKSTQNKGNKAIFVCDRIKLVDQTIDAFEDWDIYYGVIQADHHLTDYAAPIQVASAQTLGRRLADGYEPDFQLCIIDEAHVTHAAVKTLMELYPKAKFIGLSATPYSKGLGLIYDDLLVPASTLELLQAGYLCPVEYYAGAQVDLSGIKSRSLPTGGTDYDPVALSNAVESQKERLTGDIVRNWLEHGQNRQTAAFSPSIAHSKYLVEMFRKAGIKAEHIDGYTDQQERIRLFKGHDNGDFKILSCSQLLTTGWDSPTTSCLIDCFNTKSKIQFQQRAGRIFRTAPNKEYAIYLDHAGNIARNGFPEHLVPESLSKHEKKFKEDKQLKEKQEKEPKTCPKCSRIMAAKKCLCGFEFNYTTELESDNKMLVRIKSGNAKPEDRIYMGQFYSSLIKIARSRGYSDGWAAHKYKEKFNRWPRSLDINYTGEILPEVTNFVISRQIAWSKRNTPKEKAQLYQ